MVKHKTNPSIWIRCTRHPSLKLKVKELGLSKHDEQVLSSGEWLNDQLIQAAMTLLRKQFPDQNGLQSTQILARNLQWLSSNTDFVQISYISQSHWVCASNIFSSPEVCDLYDSMPPVYSSTLTSQVAAIMKCQSPCFKLRHIDVQHQSGGQDCGLFAIAFMYALCAGKDPHLCYFDQSQMRSHLHSCLQNQTMSEFPAATKPRRLGRTRVKCVRNFNVYCTCRLTWNKNQNIFGDLAKCGRCKEWFHQRCQNIPEEVYIESSYNWLCSSCSH